jgi:hypothetical protein
VVWGVAEKHT